jgi:hypothetical protein
MLTKYQTDCVICHSPLIFKALGADSFADATCEECGLIGSMIDGPFPLVERLVIRANAELSAGDWTIPIILFAMTCESLVATLHHKWTFLSSKLPHEITPQDEEDWAQSGGTVSSGKCLSC